MTEDPASQAIEALKTRVAELEARLVEERASRAQAATTPAVGPSPIADQAQPPPADTIRAEIEKRERVELALVDSEAFYHSLVEHLPVSVYRIDPEGRITFGNTAYQNDIGRPMEELLGKTVFDLFPEAEAKKYSADDEKVIATGQVIHAVEEHYVRDQQLYAEVLKCPVYDHQGRLVGVQGMYWDVTSRKRTEEQLTRAMAELERSNRELQQFAGVASHDMHAPLRRIVNLSRTVREQYEEQVDANGRELLDFLTSSAEHMQELIDDLLDHSRVGASKQPPEPVDCSWAMRKALNNLAVPVLENSAVVHVADLPTVMAHKVEMVQLFQNLVGNAIKYRRDAAPRIEVQAEPQENAWLFSVRDNGIGIGPEHHAKVFEAFRRLHSEDVYPGTGLGLATCKKIVERFDGTIWVESECGAGSRFLFTFPRS